MKDARGLDVTADHADAVAAADDFAARLLRLDQGVEAVLDAVKRWPQTPILQLYTAAFWLYGQTGEALANAASHLKACAALTLNARERALHQALALWHANDNLRAVAAMEAITAEWPGDLLTAKFAEFVYYVLGQQHMGPRFRAHMARLQSMHGNDPDFLAMAAFAGELCGDYAAAESTVERALAAAQRNPWAQHALSHVLIRQGRVPEGRARMEAFLPLLATCGVAQSIRTMRGTWRCSTLRTSTLPARCGSFTTTSGVSRRTSWSSSSTPSRCCGASRWPAPRWMRNGPPIADHVAPRAVETFMPFMNAHYVYALARAGRTDALEAALAGVRARSKADDDEATRVWAPVGRPIVEAAAAFGIRDRARAAALFDPAMSAMTAIGGSDAQDDLFRQAYLRSLQAAGRHTDAAAYFDRITGSKLRTPLDRALAS